MTTTSTTVSPVMMVSSSGAIKKSRIEIFVDLNGHLMTIGFNNRSTDSGVELCDVIDKIRQTLSLNKFNLKTHQFEVFNETDKQFVRLRTKRTLVDNGSRIRAVSKVKQPQQQRREIAAGIGGSKAFKCAVELVDTNSNYQFEISADYCNSNYHKLALIKSRCRQFVDQHCESQNVRKNLKLEVYDGRLQKYLELSFKKNSQLGGNEAKVRATITNQIDDRRSNSRRSLNTSDIKNEDTVVDGNRKMVSLDSKLVSFISMLDTINYPSIDWKLFAQNMVTFGYIYFDENECKNFFQFLTEEYYHLLNRVDISDDEKYFIWPLFKVFNEFDLKPSMSTTFVAQQQQQVCDNKSKSLSTHDLQSIVKKYITNEFERVFKPLNEMTISDDKYVSESTSDDVSNESKDDNLGEEVNTSVDQERLKRLVMQLKALSIQSTCSCNESLETNQTNHNNNNNICINNTTTLMARNDCKQQQQHHQRREGDVKQLGDQLSRKLKINSTTNKNKMINNDNNNTVVVATAASAAIAVDGDNNNKKMDNTNDKRPEKTFVKRVSKADKLKERMNFQKLSIPIKYIDFRNPRNRFHNQLNPNFIEILKTGTIDNIYLRKAVTNSREVDDQIDNFRNLVLLSHRDHQNRNFLKELLEVVLNESGIDCQFYFFGSTANSVGFRNSDIDLFVEIRQLDNLCNTLDFNTSMSYLMEMRNILKRYFWFYIPTPIASLRCPIVKINFKLFREKFLNNPRMLDLFRSLESLGICCDINITNALGLQNTKLISFYCDLDRRFQDLAIILRYWTKMNDFIGGADNAFTSYALTQLVIFFCQNQSPPILPTLDQLREPLDPAANRKIIDGWDCSFCCDKLLIPQSQNTESVIDLLPKFFKFFADFNFTTHVIQLRTGKAVHKYHFNQQIKTTLNSEAVNGNLHFKMTSFCCIQDPFNLEHNLTANLSFSIFDKFLLYIRSIAVKSDIIFSKTKKVKDWGISKIISKFDPTDDYQSLLGRNISIPNARGCVSHEDITSQEIIKTFANQICCLTTDIFENVYKIQTNLIGKYDVIYGKYSPFAEFLMDLKAIDIQVIDSNNRGLIRSELKDSIDKISRVNKETTVTETIIQRYSDKQLPEEQSAECYFVAMCVARPSGPYVEYEIIKCTESKSIKKQLKTLFESVIKLIDEKVSDIQD